jgi:hypothetical protein
LPGFCALAAWRRPRAASSEGKSRVTYALQTSALNIRRRFPSRVAEFSRSLRVDSVCNRSFAKPCQLANSKRSFQTILLCFRGSKSSKAGMEHYHRRKPTRSGKKHFLAPEEGLQSLERLAFSLQRHCC